MKPSLCWHKWITDREMVNHHWWRFCSKCGRRQTYDFSKGKFIYFQIAKYPASSLKWYVRWYHIIPAKYRAALGKEVKIVIEERDK